MSTSLILARNLENCPLAWQNFIHYFLDLQIDPDCDVPLNKVQNALSEFSARYIESWPVDHIKFESEKNLTWFVLTWS
jgi:hypothetical protein